MSTVLFAPETFNLAETTRAVEVARHLRDRHRCVFAGYSERYAGVVEDAGFEYHRLSPQLTDAQADQLIRFDQGRSPNHPFTEDVVRARVGSERELNALVRPAATVIGSTLSQLVSARADGIPLVHVRPFAYSWPHLRQARSLPLLDGRGRLAGAVNAGAAVLLREAARYTSYKPRGFARVAREYGVALPRRTVEALDGDLNLIASISGFLHPYRLPPHYRWVGPIYARLDREVPPQVTLAAGRAREAGRPVVYFAMGSSGRRDIVLRVLGELSRMPVTVLAPVAHYLEPGDLEGLGRHVHVFDLLPAHELGGLIDASVIHGGEGTVQTAVASGRPFVGIGLQMEQRSNIDDCVRFGSAVGLTPARARGERLRRAFEAVLHDPGLRARAEELRDRLAGTDGARAAADHVDALVRGAG
ncbi:MULTISPECIES: glycosyltransferase [Nocardiopsidaceae]|uniref:Glycosyltransferase n=1 Tax=Streptomonospora nanhaiensis TaxID=1323731 RepID=A0ABY6YIQ8_9ACTN|nr:nucleotide disphospho-sugar-binding domain-containing protein [Streptomonospora nanhaiensis]WAE72108.1 glycosyltransferase [Streptomonospora nanhaiensis]